jgi:hypothetical protein
MTTVTISDTCRALQAIEVERRHLYHRSRDFADKQAWLLAEIRKMGLQQREIADKLIALEDSSSALLKELS